MHRLRPGPGWTSSVAIGDSLMHGDHVRSAGRSLAESGYLPRSWPDPIYAIEDPKGCTQILGRQYHVCRRQPAVHHGQGREANETLPRPLEDLPSSILARRAVHRAVLQFGTSACRTARQAGYVGMITANSFMKREFGKKLIEEFLPTVDLTHVIDTSGAYIPGHGTPTVILFGRNRRPVSDGSPGRAWHPGRANHARRSGARAWSGGRSSITLIMGRTQNEFVPVLRTWPRGDIREAPVEHREVAVLRN